MSAGLAPSLASSLDRLARRLQELDAALSDPFIAADNKRFRDLSREHAEVSSVCDLAQRHTRRQQDLADAREMLQGAGDDAERALRADHQPVGRGQKHQPEDQQRDGAHVQPPLRTRRKACSSKAVLG